MVGVVLIVKSPPLQLKSLSDVTTIFLPFSHSLTLLEVIETGDQIKCTVSVSKFTDFTHVCSSLGLNTVANIWGNVSANATKYLAQVLFVFRCFNS